jgi:hypothetical protein
VVSSLANTELDTGIHIQNLTQVYIYNGW